MKAVKSNLGNKDQRVMLPTVSQSDENLMKIFSISCFLIRQLFRATIFLHVQCFTSKIVPWKIGHNETKFVQAINSNVLVLILLNKVAVKQIGSDCLVPK